MSGSGGLFGIGQEKQLVFRIFMSQNLRVTDSIDRQKWEDFVLNHPNGNIFHTPEMYEVYRRTKNYEPIALAVMDESNEIIALTQAVVIQEIGGPLGIFSARAVMQGGPLYLEIENGIEAVVKLMEYYEQIVRKKAIYTQIRNMWDMQEIKNTLESLNYTYNEHLNYLINLNRNSEEIWRDIQKSRKKGINRAGKSGIAIKKTESLDELDDCYQLIEGTYKNVKTPIADITLFKAAYDTLTLIGIADFYIATQHGKPVGTRITLKYNGTVHDWYAGSKKDIAYVDEALVWHILNENAKKEKSFDFGGAGHPMKPYGVREFKRRFGGEEVNYGRYEKTHSGIKKTIATMGFTICKKYLIW